MSEPQSKKTKTMSSLNQLKDLTTVVADTGDFQGKTRRNSNPFGGGHPLIVTVERWRGKATGRLLEEEGGKDLATLAFFFPERVESRDTSNYDEWLHSLLFFFPVDSFSDGYTRYFFFRFFLYTFRCRRSDYFATLLLNIL